MGYKIFASIADIHIGVKHIKANDLKKQLKDHFIDTLNNLYKLDGIFICGDIMHTIVSLNSDYSELFYWFIDQVYKIARKKNSTVIIIKGTISHDNDQLENIKSYINNDDGVDFRVYDTVEEITIWDDYKVLILPDVRVKQLKDIDQYLDTRHKYDLILGHGLIADMEFFINEMENQSTKTYVYKTEDLVSASKGPVIFGHIHNFHKIYNKFYYTGPFTLLERGGESAGFLIGGINDDDRTQFKVEFYENPDSARYYDLRINKFILDNSTVDEIVSVIDALAKEAKDNDLFTLRLIRNDELDHLSTVAFLEERYRKDKRFSIVKKIKTKKEEEREEVIKKQKERYDYVMDENLTLPEIMFKYYINEVVPTLPDKSSLSASITEDDFVRILNTKN